MSGDLLALLSAFLWAVGSVLLALGTRRVPALPLNLVRCAIATGFSWLLLPFYGGWRAVAATPPGAWLWLAVSVVALLVVGDTLYFRSMRLVGVSWAMPVASINPLWAVLLAALFLGEPLSWSLMGGALLVVAGVVLVSRSTRPGPGMDDGRWTVDDGQGSVGELAQRREAGGRAGDRRTGLLLALLTSVLWAIGQVVLRPATAGLDAVVANSIRQPFGLVMLLGLTLGRGEWHALRNLERRSWLLIGVASLVSTGIGSLLFVTAVQRAGAGRTAVLTTTAPVMALPLSMLWLGERPTRLTVIGTLLTVSGIAFLV